MRRQPAFPDTRHRNQRRSDLDHQEDIVPDRRPVRGLRDRGLGMQHRRTPTPAASAAAAPIDGAPPRPARQASARRRRSADAMAASSTAAKAEGGLTTIALPHDWCGYGEVHRRLQGEVRHHDQRAQPRRRLRRRGRGDQGQQGQQGPAGARRHRRRPVLRPAAKTDGLIAALQGLDLGHRSPTAPRMPTATGTATITACSRSR